ncbi:tripartite tricarboxylate transporter substrate-binding protein [Humitalea sp. 24SJ18S-53]|uniref:tripartite tricarboxylate transporter substrate-binding protein n=1 Tax=Humitalea sp. 24SJ18S-53 TaxID=3422307 RepID=UPI003D66F6D7
MTTIARRSILAATLAAPALAQAQDNWPNRPVRIIIPAAPGGSNDAVGRPLAERMQQILGQPVVIDNRAGAGGVIGANEVARARPDGHTLMIHSSSFATASAVQRTPYDATKDFTAVALLAVAPMLIVAAPQLPITDMNGLLAMARAGGRTLDYGSSGPGGINHMATELLAQTAGLQFQHVPYRGMGPAMTDLVAGNVQFIVTSLPSAGGLIRDNRVKLLAWTQEGRPPGTPDAPTVKQATGLDFEMGIWWGMMAPAGLPPAVLARLSAAVNEGMSDTRLVTNLAGEGAVAQTRSPEYFHDYLQNELARWRRVAATGRISVD